MTEGDADIGDDERIYNSGRMAFESGDYVRAIKLFRKSAEVEDHFKSWEMIGSSLMALGDPEAALPCFRQAFEMNPRSCKAGVLLATCMHSLGLPDEDVDGILAQVLAVNETYGPAVRLRETMGRS